LIPLFSGNAEISGLKDPLKSLIHRKWVIPPLLIHENYRFSAVFALAWWKDCLKFND